MTWRWRIEVGDARERLAAMEAGIAQMIVTSPPYFGLRDYGVAGQIGLETLPSAYVESIVAVMREAWRVLRDDGTLWLNLGDSYVTNPRGRGGKSRLSSTLTNPAHHDEIPRKHRTNMPGTRRARRGHRDGTVGESKCPDGPTGGLAHPLNRTVDPKFGNGLAHSHQTNRGICVDDTDLKHKDLIGIPWMVAFALRAEGWILRSDIVWSKPNAMPESVTDRPTRSHEYLFLLSKSRRYYYDKDAIREPVVYGEHDRNPNPDLGRGAAPGWQEQSGFAKKRRSGNKERNLADGGAVARPADHLGRGVPWTDEDGFRNRRSVWTVTTKPFAEAHFATFPTDLIEPCILAGSPPGGLVLDPFCGAGTCGLVALRHGRRFVGVDLNAEYVAMARKRIIDDMPLVNGATEDVRG